MADLIEYRPSYVKLPAQLAKDFTDYPDQQLNLQNNADYDADSLFYDVFYDMKRANIWTSGPPLYSLEADFAKNLQIFGNGAPLAYEIHRDSYSSCSFRIPVSKSQRSLTELEFVLGDVRFQCKIAEFPQTKKLTQPLMSVIQKDYAPEHVTEWLLWHYRLYGLRRFLLYDNGSANIAELTRALRELAAPLQIVLIHWRYYWGHKTRPSTDAFAQYTQLNHTRLLHSGIRRLITNWDMDEYLVCPSRAYWRLQKHRGYCLIPEADALGAPGGRLSDCARVSGDARSGAVVSSGWKYFYTSGTTGIIRNVHALPSPAMPRGVWRRLVRLGARVIDRLLRRSGFAPPLYILHAIYLRQNWNARQTDHLAAQTKAMKHGEANYRAFQQCYKKSGLSD